MPGRSRSGSTVTDETLLLDGATRLGLDLNREGARRLSLYCDELERWNRRINLVARRTGRDGILEKHFLDSLTLLPLLAPGDSLLDVGSGAGFPGLVLAAARPEMEVTLVEPRQKRVAFLRHVVRTLGLSSVRIRACRLEEEAFDAAGFSFVTGRAVAEPPRFLAMVEPLLVHGARAILMLSAAGRRQWPDARMTGFRVLEERHCILPFSGSTRVLVVVAAGRPEAG